MTILDVAARASVSRGTVTRVLTHGGRRVSPEARDRVLAAAAELNYIPNRSAQRLRASSSRILALTVVDISDPFCTAIARGAEDVADEHGYNLLVANTDRDETRQQHCLRNLAAERVVGVILASVDRLTDGVADLTRAHIPLVALDRHPAGVTLDSVTTDNEAGAYQAVQHLIGLGHVRIGIIGGPEWMSTMRDRLKGALRALRERDLERTSIVRLGDGWETGGFEMMLQVLGAPEPPTAVFTCNDLTTIGALKAFQARGIRLPEEMSFVGFDDLPTAELLDPPLTVIAQPSRRLGAQAAELLLRRIAEPDAPLREVVLAPSLILRGSTALHHQATT